MKPIFRRYKDNDAAAIAKLMKQLGYIHTVATIQNNVTHLRKRDCEVFVAELHNKTIGCISAIIDVRLAEGIKGEIVSLVVAEHVRGQGIGKKLVQHAEQWLTPRVTEIRIRANRLRTDAHTFYEKLGYAQNKEQLILLKALRNNNG